MTEYASNSHKSKEQQEGQLPEKKIEKVVSGPVKTKKKSEIRKFTDVFVSEDMDSVKSYIFMDVIVPAVKKAISDVVTNGIDMLLYGETGGRNNTKKNSASRVSYRSYYDSQNDRRERPTTRMMGYEYDEIVLDNRGEAESVLDRMDEIVSTYGMVSVADFYDLIGVTSKYTDNKYGWTNISNAHIVRTRDGYMIKMPKALPLD